MDRESGVCFVHNLIDNIKNGKGNQLAAVILINVLKMFVMINFDKNNDQVMRLDTNIIFLECRETFRSRRKIIGEKSKQIMFDNLIDPNRRSGCRFT